MRAKNRLHHFTIFFGALADGIFCYWHSVSGGRDLRSTIHAERSGVLGFHRQESRPVRRERFERPVDQD